MSLAVAIAGAGGRMGRALLEVAAADPAIDHVIALGRSAEDGADAERPYRQRLQEALARATILVDFTAPALLDLHAEVCRECGAGWVLGTTGMNDAQQAAVDRAAEAIAVCQAANFSSGVTLLLRLVEQAAAALEAETDLEVIEAHHRHKVDAPSGTALAIGRAMARGRGIALDDCAVYQREGLTGPRPADAIGFATVRGGDIVGEHTALFAGDGERLEITHRAGSRQAFARGALRAARWLAGRPPGRYGMDDVLGFETGLGQR